MPARTTEARALELIDRLEKAGKTVLRVVVEGRKIEIELAQKDAPQNLDGLDWR